MSPGYPNAVSAPLLLKTSQQLQLRESSINLGWVSYICVNFDLLEYLRLTFCPNRFGTYSFKLLGQNRVKINDNYNQHYRYYLKTLC